MKKSLVTSSLKPRATKKSTKTLNYINPKTTNEQLKIFSQLTTALTNNTYITADVVKKMNVNELDEADLSGRPVPELTLNYWDYLDPIYFASISYAGDGVLDTSTGTIVGGILAVLAPDGNFSGFLTATGSESFAPAQLMFSHVTENVVEEVTKPAPNLTLSEWNKANDVYTATISYDGDGDLSTSEGAIVGGTMLTITDGDGNFNGIITASEGETFAAAVLVFNHRTEEIEAATADTLNGDCSLEALLVCFDNGLYLNSADTIKQALAAILTILEREPSELDIRLFLKALPIILSASQSDVFIDIAAKLIPKVMELAHIRGDWADYNTKHCEGGGLIEYCPFRDSRRIKRHYR